ncbi:MAG: DUF2934 domain-containing protein [Planctomycetota bacterium]
MSPRKAATETKTKKTPSRRGLSLRKRKATPAEMIAEPVVVQAQAPVASKPKTAPLKPVVVGKDEIAARAYAIWESMGRPAGQEAAHWRQAEREYGVAA